MLDLAYEGARKIKGAKIDEGSADKGPLVVPGTYTARLVVDGRTYTAPIVVRPDPRVTVPEEDLAAEARFALEVRDQITRLTGIVEDLRSVRRRLGVVEADGAPTQGMRDVFQGQKQELDSLAREFHGLMANDLAALNRSARELNLADVAPPEAAPAR